MTSAATRKTTLSHPRYTTVAVLLLTICAQCSPIHKLRHRGNSRQAGDVGRASLIGSHHAGRPFNPNADSEENDGEEIDTSTYLMQFGYLPQSDIETGALRTKAELVRAVRRFQRFAHLRPTGQLDPLTRSMMKRARCGVPDLSDEQRGGRRRGKRYALAPSKWRRKTLTYRIKNFTPDLNSGETKKALQKAFDLWSGVAQLNFSEVPYGDADIVIKFARLFHGDGYPFDGKGKVLAHAFYPGHNKGGDVHFDEDENWSSGRQEKGTSNLLVVATHEIGHALGLAHSSVSGALMFPWYQGYSEDFKLHADDVAAIRYLYGMRYQPKDGGKAITLPPGGVYPTVPPTPEPTYSYIEHPGGSGKAHKPDPCTARLDAVATIRDETHLFQGEWFWRKNKHGMMDGYPVKFNRFWYGLPRSLEHFDAVYERPGDGKIVFFSGNRQLFVAVIDLSVGAKYWLFDGNNLAMRFPKEGRNLTEMGFPTSLKKIDAAFVWGHNSKTYLISGDMYWRYNELERRMDYDYPRDIGIWAGVQTPVSAATQSTDGNTYFFKEDQYWQFNDLRMKVEDEDYPQSTAAQWLDCKRVVKKEASRANSASSSKLSPQFCVTLLASLMLQQFIVPQRATNRTFLVLLCSLICIAYSQTTCCVARYSIIRNCFPSIGFTDGQCRTHAPQVDNNPQNLPYCIRY